MRSYYLDTSALTKLFVEEPGSAWLLKLTSQDSSRLYVCTLARVEFHSAVRRREREGSFSWSDAEALLKEFDQELRGNFLQQPATPAVLDSACQLLSRFSLRAYDALQLAACHSLVQQDPRIVFLCADQQLLRAAKDLGMAADNPNDHA